MVLRFGTALGLTTVLKSKNSMGSSYGCGVKASKIYQKSTEHSSVCLLAIGGMYLAIFTTESCTAN